MSTLVYTFTANGTFDIPAGYRSIIIELWGPGGGGGGVNQSNGSSTDGQAGSNTTISSLSLIAGSGQGGQHCNSSFFNGNDTANGAGGSGGIAIGGDTNIFGGNGLGILGNGGDAPNGSIAGGQGGLHAKNSPGHDGSSPGGGGSGGNDTYFIAGEQFLIQGGGGGGGGYLIKTYSPGILSGTLIIEIGSGGIAGSGSVQSGSFGAKGECIITVIGSSPQAVVTQFGFP